MAWIDPTGFDDPGSEWTGETNIYDNSTTSHGDRLSLIGWSNYIVLTHAAFWCDKIQIYVYRRDANVSVEVSYYDGSWHVIYNGAYTDRQWTEISLGGTYNITAIRLRFYNAGASVNIYFYECDFNEAGAPPVEGIKWNGVTITKWNGQVITKLNGLP